VNHISDSSENKMSLSYFQNKYVNR